ncbi:MAG: pyridoxal 5'-phosphate synthase glutaminase subunit PdxT [Candidatus Obscuribacterales bacterium]|nr:pyridoxal 5'-phosphate synthase glutaminase subunit PdxT [Candidatus Obscuribacterales bacterium]
MAKLVDTTTGTSDLKRARHTAARHGAGSVIGSSLPPSDVGTAQSVNPADKATVVTIGVLALQGDFAEHAHMLQSCGAKTKLVRRAAELDGIDGLVIPGGESTTIAKLTGNTTDPLFDAIIERAKDGMPVYGTCMGMIFLAREIEGSEQGRLALMDITVRRNAFGPQIASREEHVAIDELGAEPFPAVFIRGPIILGCAPHVQVYSKVAEGIVMCRQNNLLATAFHPEITDDLRVHQYFVKMVRKYACVRV